ncbi:MAG: EamA family transporter [Rickettsiales bacterium]|nr:EamA family transporter [Rickettsiales bacterium]
MGPLPILLAIIVTVCWGGNFAASKYALLHFPPFFAILIRYIVVSIVLLPFAKRMEISFKQLSLLALMMITLHFTLVFTALWMGLSIGTTVIAIQLGAPFSCVLSAIFLNEKLGAWRSMGMAIAFMGIIVIAGTPNVAHHEIAFMFAIVGAFFWACTNIYMKKLGQQPVMPMLFWTSVLSIPQNALVSFVIESNHLQLMETAPFTAWFGIVYSGLVSTIVGYGLWYWLIKRYDVSQVAPYSLLVPISGFTAGIVFFNEAMTVQMMMGALITIVGVAIITIRKPRHAQMGR